MSLLPTTTTASRNSASRFSKVCETSVPGHDRQRLAHPADPARDDQRTRRLTESRRERRRHQHPDRGGAQDRAPFHRPVRQRRAHDVEPRDRPQDHRAWRTGPARSAPRSGSSARASWRRCRTRPGAARGTRAARRRSRTGRAPRGATPASVREPRERLRRSRLDRGQPPGARARSQVALHEPGLDARGLRSADAERAPRSRARTRTSPGARPAATRSPLRVGARRRSSRARRAGSSHSERSASASSSGSPGVDQQAVAAVRHDLAVAGDLGGDDRRAGRKRLRQHHAEALAAERGRAQHVGLVQALPQLCVVDAARAPRCRRCRPRPARAAARRRRPPRRSPAAAPGCAGAGRRMRTAGRAGPCAPPRARRTRCAARRLAASDPRGAAPRSTPLGITSYVPPK